jgi:hypothetical protein
VIHAKHITEVQSPAVTAFPAAAKATPSQLAASLTLAAMSLG